MRIWLLILLLEVVYVRQSIQVATGKLKISIYYESLCEDSVKFITQQLYPAYPAIKSSVLIDFVPYGKATQSKSNGDWVFKCQHGPEECWGNKAQACGLAEDKGQDANVEFINCVMKQPDAATEGAINIAATDLINVSIYYESLCPASIQFITQQLYPAYPEIKSSVLIDFVPYGHAEQIIQGGKRQFKCQHGEEECWGNMAQACGLAESKGQDADVEFINCAMSQPKPATEEAIKICAPKLNVTAESIIDCAGGLLGNYLHANYGFQTHGLRPAFEPTIVFNGYFDENLQYAATKDFLSTVRSLLVKAPTPTTSTYPWYLPTAPTGNVFDFNCCCC